MIILKTKRPNVVAYLRPSVNAIKGTHYKKSGEALRVYPLVRGWFEIRISDPEGGTHAEFVRWRDVKPKARFFLPLLKKRIKNILK